MLSNAVKLVYKDLIELDKLVIQTLSIIEHVLTKINLKNQTGIIKLLSFITSVYYALPGIFTPAQ